MTARQQFEFEQPGRLTTKYGVGVFQVSKPIPDNYEDLLKMFHVANDYDKITNKQLQDFVTFLTNGDLNSLKLMDEKFIKRYLNSAVMYGDMMANGLPSKGEIMGLSPLMIAAMCGKTDVMRWLIEKGADIGLKTYPGKSTATDFLKRYKEQQEKKRAEELRKQREKDEKQKQKAELDDLMDEVDDKEKSKPHEQYHVDKSKTHSSDKLFPVPGLNKGDGRIFDEMLREHMEKIKEGKEPKRNGGKGKKRQIGNGKGIDDLIAKSQGEKGKNKDRWGNELPPNVRDL